MSEGFVLARNLGYDDWVRRAPGDRAQPDPPGQSDQNDDRDITAEPAAERRAEPIPGDPAKPVSLRSAALDTHRDKDLRRHARLASLSPASTTAKGASPAMRDVLPPHAHNTTLCVRHPRRRALNAAGGLPYIAGTEAFVERVPKERFGGPNGACGVPVGRGARRGRVCFSRSDDNYEHSARRVPARGSGSRAGTALGSWCLTRRRSWVRAPQRPPFLADWDASRLCGVLLGQCDDRKRAWCVSQNLRRAPCRTRTCVGFAEQRLGVTQEWCGHWER